MNTAQHLNSYCVAEEVFIIESDDTWHLHQHLMGTDVLCQDFMEMIWLSIFIFSTLYEAIS
jgi:hypothetical protein